MAEKTVIDAMWDDSPIDVSTEVNFIWSIANKLRGPYQSDKYKDVIIPSQACDEASDSGEFRIDRGNGRASIADHS
ncbi:MAG: hypothetical protein J6L84_00875 [Clostridiales bacterium]|nr:hypothetical protein [Clostridiales bacterium]